MRQPKDIWASVTATYRDLGALDGSLYFFASAFQRVSRGCIRLHKYRFIAQPVAAKPWLPDRRGADIDVREIGPADPLLTHFPRPQAAMPYRFGQGAVCLAAFKDGRCAGFLWFVVGPYHEDEVRCRYQALPEREASWDFDLYIYPEYRNSLVFLRLWDEANRHLASRGVRWSMSRISAFKPGSLSSHLRMGAREIGTALFLSLGHLQISWATVAPRFFVSRQGNGSPNFVLSARLANKY
jgi:hypothetical protein